MSYPLLLLALLSLSVLAAAGIGPHGHHASTAPHGPHAGTSPHGHHLAGQGHHIQLKLHRHPPHPHATKLEHVHDLVNSDRVRHRAVTGKLRPHAVSNASFSMVVNSGMYRAKGSYFVRLQVGTPAQKFLVVPDTGSEITWMRCKYQPNGPDWPGRRVFDTAASKSFKAIECSSDICRNRLPNTVEKCPSQAGPCEFHYGYVDGTFADGIYANEWATVASLNGQKTKLQGLVVGCATHFGGNNFDVADGILGLGFNDETFAVHASQVYGGRFSYCLVDHLSPKNVSSYLTFGPNPALTAPSQTPLILDPVLLPFYGIAIESISIGGEVLPIPASVWDPKQDGGVIVDSGQTLTTMPFAAYNLVVAAIHKHLAALPRLSDPEMEYCYVWPAKGAPEVPQLVIHLAGGAKLEPPPKSYVIAVSQTAKCIGFQGVEGPIWSTIGNILQQEHLWEFDLKNQQLRFQQDTCDPKKH